ncbi:hypothetical protein TRAPUB_7247 [Trametes pubescens]|uniref:Uncharacterized protein n=1 Tax=Trametes pubescens TaxID=154538 RepID=A0A1M2V3P6_TRAPU|nr:hypothetical protein TRAPUB_7247 [Trametes pubescens]
MDTSNPLQGRVILHLLQQVSDAVARLPQVASCGSEDGLRVIGGDRYKVVPMVGFPRIGVLGDGEKMVGPSLDRWTWAASICREVGRSRRRRTWFSPNGLLTLSTIGLLLYIPLVDDFAVAAGQLLEILEVHGGTLAGNGVSARGT